MECFAKQASGELGELTLEKLKMLQIDKPDRAVFDRVIHNWDSIAKPIGSMGEFEKLTAQIGAVQGSDLIRTDKKALLIMCSDNGVTEEGISQSPSSVTGLVVRNMLHGKSSALVMAAKGGVTPFVVDVGVDAEYAEGSLDFRIRRGTGNFAKEPAMTEEEALKAIQTGIGLVKQCADDGYGIIALGEMGIGNTTTSAAVCAALLRIPCERVTGHGAGLDEEGFARKKKVIEEAIRKYDLYQKDAFEILCCVGGFDIAALAGACIGGALYHIPIVLDGVITLTAALLAESLVKGCREYLIASHKGKEPAAEVLLDALGKKAVIDAGMALGEGSGAVMFLGLLDQALEVYRSAARFEDIEIEQYTRFDSL